MRSEDVELQMIAMKEFEMLGQLYHENIITVKDFFQDTLR